MYQVVLGTPETAFAARARALLEEASGFTVVEEVDTGGEVMAALGRRDADVVLLHEDLGPLPVADLTREIALRHPHVGVVLAVREATPDAYRTALESGARGLVTLPLSLEELHGGALAAGVWSRTVRERLTGDAAALDSVGGTMVALSGAKGGVGTTTLAIHLALKAAGTPGARVCLVDFDLQAGDVPALLDVTHRRSVADLLEVAEDVSARHLDEGLYRHPSGLRVLLAPHHGERAEDISARIARRILGAIKSRFDVVVVDCGTVVTEAGAVAVEMADRALVVATPDVPALLAAKRLLGLWERLQVRKSDDAEVVLNRASRRSEVQPELARKIVEAPLCASIPAAFRDLEPAVNARAPERLEGGALVAAVAGLAQELGVAAVEPRRPRRGRRGRGDGGQVAVEAVGLAGIVLLVALALWQLALIGYTFALAGHAAREGARRLAVGAPVAEAARADLPSAWRDGFEVEVRADEPAVHVTLAVPAFLPGLESPWHVSASAGTVRER